MPLRKIKLETRAPYTYNASEFTYLTIDLVESFFPTRASVTNEITNKIRRISRIRYRGLLFSIDDDNSFYSSALESRRGIRGMREYFISAIEKASEQRDARKHGR